MVLAFRAVMMHDLLARTSACMHAVGHRPKVPIACLADGSAPSAPTPCFPVPVVLPSPSAAASRTRPADEQIEDEDKTRTSVADHDHDHGGLPAASFHGQLNQNFLGLLCRLRQAPQCIRSGGLPAALALPRVRHSARACTPDEHCCIRTSSVKPLAKQCDACQFYGIGCCVCPFPSSFGVQITTTTTTMTMTTVSNQCLYLYIGLCGTPRHPSLVGGREHVMHA